MQPEDATYISDATPRLRRATHLQLRYYKGMYVMHRERFRELRKAFWDARARGDREAARFAMEDAEAMVEEATRLMRLQQATRKRLITIFGSLEPPPELERRATPPQLMLVRPPDNEDDPQDAPA